MPRYRVQGPDGAVHVFEGPEGATPAEVEAFAAQTFGGKQEAPQPAKPAGPEVPWQLRALVDGFGGALRGAGSIGATGLRALGIDNAQESDARRKAMTETLGGLGFDTDSFAFGAGKLGGEIAGTAGVGGTLANVLGRVPGVASKAPAALDALRTAGMTAGGATGKTALALRTAGGGATGGASAALVNPEDAAAGATIGALLPGGVQLAGLTAHKLGMLLRGPDKKAAERLAQALGITNPDDAAQVAAQLQRAQTMVAGSKPTVSQVLRTPQASTLERVVSESPGGAALKERYLAQNTARMGALESVAPVNPLGLRTAQDAFGTSALNVTKAGDEAARGATRAAYQAVPQDEAAFYLPALSNIRDDFYPVAGIGKRGTVDEVVNAAERIGFQNLDPVKAARSGPTQQSLAQAVRKAGGISIKDNSGLRGEVAGLRGDLKNLVRVNGGKSPADMAEAMRQQGFLQSDDTEELFDLLRREAMGQPVTSIFDDAGGAWRAAQEAAMGDAPGAARVPQKITLRQFDALRKEIGAGARAAARDPERATEAAALGQMKATLDDRINEVVRGDGLPDEVLPIDWANKLDEARRLKVEQVQKYRTGPQSEAFKMGADGLPKVRGGEFAAKVWSTRPGAAADVRQFMTIMRDHPKLMGEFKSMVTTEGASTATNAGRLTGKFVRWVDNALPGLKESFKPEEVKALQRIAADIKRAEMAAAAGAASGSPTYQNAANALSLGLLDSPLVNAAANRIPLVNAVSGPALTWMRETARGSQANALANLLLDPTLAANALAPQAAQRGINPQLQNLFRAAPVLGPGLMADR